MLGLISASHTERTHDVVNALQRVGQRLRMFCTPTNFALGRVRHRMNSHTGQIKGGPERNELVDLVEELVKALVLFGGRRVFNGRWSELKEGEIEAEKRVKEVMKRVSKEERRVKGGLYNQKEGGIRVRREEVPDVKEGEFYNPREGGWQSVIRRPGEVRDESKAVDKQETSEGQETTEGQESTEGDESLEAEESEDQESREERQIRELQEMRDEQEAPDLNTNTPDTSHNTPSMPPTDPEPPTTPTVPLIPLLPVAE